MPKETIKDTSMDGWELRVGWDKSGGDFHDGVEIITVAKNEPLIRDDIVPESNGWPIHFDEERLAQLIRVLQKAGRQRFGRRPW